jgi:hypothetical protein
MSERGTGRCPWPHRDSFRPGAFVSNGDCIGPQCRVFATTGYTLGDDGEKKAIGGCSLPVAADVLMKIHTQNAALIQLTIRLAQKAGVAITVDEKTGAITMPAFVSPGVN